MSASTGAPAGVVLDRLLVQHARQRADLVPDLGRLLELQRLGARHHLRLQRIHQLLLLALQEALGVGDVARVVVGRDVVDARARAALDLVEQARPGAVGEHRVLAGAQVEHLLDQLDRVLHRPGGRERAEVAVLLVDRAAVVGDARKAVRLDLQVRIALVVDEADVEARRQRLDQVVLEQQRLGLRAHHRRLHAGDPRDHVAGPDRAFAAGVALGEVARDALLQVARLADVEHVVGGVEEAVDAGQVRQRRDLGEEALARRGAIVFARNIDRRLAHRRRLCRACECPRAAAATPCRRAASTPPARAVSIIGRMQWDLFCRVVDNFGDIGVAWRLAADLAGRGESVRLAVDDASALAWMAPHGAAGVEVVGWHDGAVAGARRRRRAVRRAAGRRSRVAGGRSPRRCCVNLEHLSAEPYVERSHGLPSPRRARRRAAVDDLVLLSRLQRSDRRPAARAGPARAPPRASAAATTGWRRSASRRAQANAASACSAIGNDAVAELLDALAAAPTLLLLTPGAAAEQVAAALGADAAPRRAARGAPAAARAGRLRPPALVVRPQLRSRRGLARARALGRRALRLAALRRRTTAPTPPSSTPSSTRFLAGAPAALAAALRALFARWNGIGASGRWRRPRPTPTLRAAWLAHCARWRDALAAQDDLDDPAASLRRVETLEFEALRPADGRSIVTSRRRLQ